MNFHQHAIALIASASVLVTAMPALAHGAHTHGAHQGELLKSKGYTIEFVKTSKGEDGTFDVYVTDVHKAVVNKGDVSIDLTAADGHKLSAKLAPTGDHFSGVAKLEDEGAYVALVKLKLGKTSINGRFPFNR
jgi:hypothetical protein